MSATGRGAIRALFDRYDTPPWPVHRLVEACPLPLGQWLEPCVGGHGIVNAINALPSFRDGVEWTTCDIDPRVSCDYTGSYLEDCGVHLEHFNVGMTNPPFKHAQAFAQKMRTHCDVVALLLRLNFLEGDERNEWLRADPPDVYVLPNRPSFDGEGTDATAYAWLVWRRDAATRGPIWRPLATTPRHVRCP